MESNPNLRRTAASQPPCPHSSHFMQAEPYKQYSFKAAWGCGRLTVGGLLEFCYNMRGGGRGARSGNMLEVFKPTSLANVCTTAWQHCSINSSGLQLDSHSWFCLMPGRICTATLPVSNRFRFLTRRILNCLSCLKTKKSLSRMADQDQTHQKRGVSQQSRKGGRGGAASHGTHI